MTEQIFDFKAWNTKTRMMYDSISELYFNHSGLKEVVFTGRPCPEKNDAVWEFKQFVKLRPFVGMYTVDNTPIYCDDIVQFTAFGRTVTGVVEWYIDDGHPGYCIVDIDGSGTIWSFDYDDLKIIGNIYENHELLDTPLK